MKSCLFVVDVQDGFISSKTNHVPKRIESLLEQHSHSFDLIVFTRFVNTEDSPYVQFLNWRKFFSDEDIKLVDELQPFTHRNNAVVFDKTVYTSINVAILSLLKQERIEEAYICGIDTDCCVLQSAVNLFEQGIRPIVLAHYSASNGGEVSHQAALTVLGRSIGRQNILLDELKIPAGINL